MLLKIYIIGLCCLTLAPCLLSHQSPQGCKKNHGPPKPWPNHSNNNHNEPKPWPKPSPKPCPDSKKGTLTTGTGLSHEVSYPTELRFDATASQCNCFKVEAKNQVHIGIFSNKTAPKTDPWVEIVVGGDPDGTGTIFRKNGVDQDTYSSHPNSLNEYEYREFCVSYAGGKYRVAYVGQPPFMSWDDPAPFTVAAIGVDTCCGTIGKVIPTEPKCTV